MQEKEVNVSLKKGRALGCQTVTLGTKRIHHWCSVGTGTSQPEGPPFQWETRLRQFSTGTVDPRVGISPFHCTPMINSISHISNQRTIGPVNAHLISWPSKAQNIHNLENIW